MSERLEDLIERHLNDELSANEKRELVELLDSNPEARRKLVEQAEFNSAITSVLNSDRNIEIGDIPFKTASPQKGVKEFIPWIIAIAACLMLVFKIFNSSPKNEIVSTPDKKPLTALLVNEVNAKFANGRSIDDVKFSPGEYELTDGAVHLRFSSGADLVVEAPAKLKIFDAMNTRLLSGKVRAMVPPPAQGFTVAANDLHYEDIGTEFGLKVDEKGSSELHVFDGQVNVKDSKNNSLLKKVFKGQAIEYSDIANPVEKDLQPDDFMTVGSIGFQRWRIQADKMSQDPDVIACYPFIRGDSDVLKNTVENSRVTDGKIVGARWVSGRWPGKEALLFDRKNDYVEMDIPIQVDEITVSMWLKIDRLDTVLSPLFSSNRWDEGDIHLQMFRHQQPHFDVQGSGVGPIQKSVSNKPAPIHDWIHIVGVFSSRESYGKVYINGELYRYGKFRKDVIIKPGKCRIGHWVPVPRYESERRFTGKVDELVIWKKALSEKEISSLVEKGRPSVLWSAGTQ